MIFDQSQGLYLTLACHWVPFPVPGCLVGPQWKRMSLILVGLDVPAWGGTQVRKFLTHLAKKSNPGVIRLCHLLTPERHFN